MGKASKCEKVGLATAKREPLNMMPFRPLVLVRQVPCAHASAWFATRLVISS